MARAFRSRLSCRTKDRCKEMLKSVPDANESAHDGEQCKDHQRYQHDGRALMRFAMSMISLPVCAMAVRIHLRSAVVAEKRHKQQPEHIERSDEGGNDSDQPVNPASVLTGKGFPENFVLAPEA